MLVQKAAPHKGGTRIFPARGLLGDLVGGPLVRGQARMATHCEGACFYKRAVNLGPIQTTVIDCWRPDDPTLSASRDRESRFQIVLHRRGAGCVEHRPDIAVGPNEQIIAFAQGELVMRIE